MELLMHGMRIQVQKQFYPNLVLKKWTEKLAISGGQKKRVALAQVLIENPDLFILDEPTNHLDYGSVKWLENYLNNYQGAILLVTHDRYFLDHVTNRIFELDKGTIYSYQGNYEAFISAKALREEEMQEANKNESLP